MHNFILRKIVAVALTAVVVLTSAAGARADSARIVSDNVVGCRSLQKVYELAGLAEAKDMPALKRAFTSAIGSGECVAFARGDPVEVVETRPQSKLLKVMRSDREYWLGYPAVGR